MQIHIDNIRKSLHLEHTWPLWNARNVLKQQYLTYWLHFVHVLPKWPGFTAGSLNERFAESKSLKKNELATK